MGTAENPQDIGDAAALTPSLYLGHSLKMSSLWLGTPQAVQFAVDHIQSGGTVLTPDPALAMEVMVRLGIPVPEALGKIDRATHVVDIDTSIIDF